MDKRKLNILINRAGGTAGANSVTHRITIPNIVAKDMGITKDDREVDFEYNEETKVITIKKSTK